MLDYHCLGIDICPAILLVIVYCVNKTTSMLQGYLKSVVLYWSYVLKSLKRLLFHIRFVACLSPDAEVQIQGFFFIIYRVFMTITSALSQLFVEIAL